MVITPKSPEGKKDLLYHACAGRVCFVLWFMCLVIRRRTLWIFFVQFCDLAKSKNTQPNLAIHIYHIWFIFSKNCYPFIFLAYLMEVTIKFWQFESFFACNLENLGYFFSIKNLSHRSKSYFPIKIWRNFTNWRITTMARP